MPLSGQKWNWKAVLRLGQWASQTPEITMVRESQEKLTPSDLQSTCQTFQLVCSLNKALIETGLIVPKDCQIKFGSGALGLNGLLKQKHCHISLTSVHLIV